MRAFLCHAFSHSDFVMAVARCLRKKLDGGVFTCEEKQGADPSFVTTIDMELGRCNIMVVFAGPVLTGWQKKEIAAFQALSREMPRKRAFVVCLLGTQALPEGMNLLRDDRRVDAPNLVEAQPGGVATDIDEAIHSLPLFSDGDGLPGNPHLFSYEKHIIDYFAKCVECEGKPLPEDLQVKQQEGCPPQWPRVPRWTRKGQADQGTEKLVVAAALSQYHQPRCEANCVRGCMVLDGPSFPEAVRRAPESLYFPFDYTPLKVGIVVCGGIAPGINAVIDGIVQRHELYAGEGKYRKKLAIMGLKNGFLAFDNLDDAACELDGVESGKYATEGGSFLGTSRDRALSSLETRQERLKSIVGQLRSNHYDIVYVIGGDGSMKAAHALWTVADEQWKELGGQRVSVVAVPKTMDNDILWVWQAFGFMSAVEKAREIISHIGTEVQSNPRLYVVQLFGSDSGFVVSHAVLASKGNLCDVALIPEIEFSMPKLAEHMRKKIRKRAESRWEPLPGGLVVMAETAIPTDAMEYIDDNKIGLNGDEKTALRNYCAMRDKKGRIQGQTDEHLRSAGLKIVSKGLSSLLQETNQHKETRDLTDSVLWDKLRVFTNEPRHLLRAIPPSCTDIIFGNRLGTLAVDNAMAGYTDFMISQWLTEYVLVPLQLVVLGRKRIPDGMFWRSVIAKTGQDASLK